MYFLSVLFKRFFILNLKYSDFPETQQFIVISLKIFISPILTASWYIDPLSKKYFFKNSIHLNC